jgi:GNAT superfamily N-acetyltransferase
MLLAVYQQYVRSPRCVSLVAEVDGKVVAAVNGAIGSGFVRDVAYRHPVRVLLGLVRVLVGEPRLRAVLLRRAVAIVRRQPRPQENSAPRRRFIWRSQAVAPAFRGGGLIFPLIKHMIQELQRRGVEEIYSTPEVENHASTWIHRVLGFRRIGERMGENGTMQAIFILPLRASGIERAERA